MPIRMQLAVPELHVMDVCRGWPEAGLHAVPDNGAAQCARRSAGHRSNPTAERELLAPRAVLQLCCSLGRTPETPCLLYHRVFGTTLTLAPDLPQPNRGRSWWWTSSSEKTLDATIATAHEMGVELLFFDGMLSNQGDYTADLGSWPSGLAAAGARIKAANLLVGLHMIDTG